MNNDFTIARIEDIDRQMALLLYKPCECDLHLEIKIRVFGGGEHYVRQCNNCGRQKGGALKAIDALDELKGLPPHIFDPAIEDGYDIESQIRSKKLSLLSHEKFQLLYGETESIYSEQDKKYRDAYQILSEHIDTFIQTFDMDKALFALYQQEIRIKKEKRESSEEYLSLFSSEAELKEWMFNLLKYDFHIYQEVTGTHITENLKVRIDYVLYPKAHLVKLGFEPAPFGIEVKYLNQEKDFAHKASRSIWQSISYNDCEFSINDKKFSLKFCLLFSNLSFSNEMDILKLNSDHVDEKYMKWVGILNVANHAKVGVLKVIGKRERVKGWSMSFAGGGYFNCRIDRNERIYKLSNANTINKVRVGNF
ncbi:hypothetical protein H4F64_02925 [Pectobacterium brasiliense]|uniref:hypothetical protein n=1 Tax=Pectobacterium brasiliense TaxID=180957 RepID=UPI001968B4E0|nr:hypothetical protein [Pectobacterium brasiliense]MBN3189165.1 hypothetical protein [Pectobacterium brasiliense]